MIEAQRYKLEAQEKWREFAETVPAIPFKPEWFIQVIPPFSGAMGRLRVYLSSDTTSKGARFVSVYLDAYDALGYVGHPYWEIYPIEGDCERFDMMDVAGLVDGIHRSLTEERISED